MNGVICDIFRDAWKGVEGLFSLLSHFAHKSLRIEPRRGQREIHWSVVGNV